jgi:hypothetical protein
VTRGLVDELDVARADFLDALSAVDADLVTVPGVLDGWSVRDLVVHVAAWDDHATGALSLAVEGRGAEFAYSQGDTDAMNERILADGRSVAPAEALAREEAAFGRFREAVLNLDPALLSLKLGNGDTVEEVIRYDGADHYADHSGHVRAWFGVDDDEDADEDKP